MMNQELRKAIHSDEISVVVAEDDYLVAKDISRALKSLGYSVAGEASNGLEAVELVASIQPDVVVMDIQMPYLNGLEAAERIQQECPTPIIILTAYESADILNKAGQVGVSAYVTKPIKAKVIERAIVIALARHQDLLEVQLLNQKLREKAKALEEALAEIKTLRGILPICSQCKKIRDDKGLWEEVESYISEHSDADFTHSICPECEKELYGNENWYKKWKDED